MRNTLVLAAALVSLSCGGNGPPDVDDVAGVYFIAPADGAMVGDTVHLQLGARGITIVAANGQRAEGEAHHHLFIDTDPTPDSVMIGRDDLTRHLGTGADTISLVLTPGTHRIIAVAAWGDHFPVPGVGRDTLTIEIRAPAITP